MRDVDAREITSDVTLETVQFGSVEHQISSTAVTRGKNYINTVRFLTQTARFVS